MKKFLKSRNAKRKLAMLFADEEGHSSSEETATSSSSAVKILRETTENDLKIPPPSQVFAKDVKLVDSQYSLRDQSKKTYVYEDADKENEDFSPDCSEYLPSPDRSQLHTPSNCSSLGGDSECIDQILGQSKNISTPSTISNLSVILDSPKQVMMDDTLTFNHDDKVQSILDISLRPIPITQTDDLDDTLTTSPLFSASTRSGSRSNTNLNSSIQSKNETVLCPTTLSLTSHNINITPKIVNNPGNAVITNFGHNINSNTTQERESSQSAVVEIDNIQIKSECHELRERELPLLPDNMIKIEIVRLPMEYDEKVKAWKCDKNTQQELQNVPSPSLLVNESQENYSQIRKANLPETIQSEVDSLTPNYLEQNVDILLQQESLLISSQLADHGTQPQLHEHITIAVLNDPVIEPRDSHAEKENPELPESINDKFLRKNPELPDSINDKYLDKNADIPKQPISPLVTFQSTYDDAQQQLLEINNITDFENEPCNANEILVVNTATPNKLETTQLAQDDANPQSLMISVEVEPNSEDNDIDEQLQSENREGDVDNENEQPKSPPVTSQSAHDDEQQIAVGIEPCNANTILVINTATPKKFETPLLAQDDANPQSLMINISVEVEPCSPNDVSITENTDTNKNSGTSPVSVQINNDDLNDDASDKPQMLNKLRKRVLEKGSSLYCLSDEDLEERDADDQNRHSDTEKRTNSEDNDIDEQLQSENREGDADNENGSSSALGGRRKKLTRKRTFNKNEWIDNKNKKLKNSGKSYTGARSKKVHEAKKMKPVCSCKRNCGEKFTESERKAIFEKFYSLSDHELQWQFIVRHTKSADIKKLSLERKRNRTQTIRYFMNKDDEEILVCRKFFLNTLSISEQSVYTALEKIKQDESLTDKRGCHLNRPRKMKESTEKSIETHIKLFPAVDPHYTRKTSKRQYLQENLNISKMYRLYKIWFAEQNFTTEEGTTMATKSQYQKIFNTKFNYSFHKPKKDQCMTCYSYRNAEPAEKQILEEKYRLHIEKKDKVRKLRDHDKETADEQDTTVAVFDLQKVIQIPQSPVGEFHYKRKYPVYNFTIFDMLRKKGHCYVWHAAIGNKGCTEIGSSLFIFLKNEKAKGIKKITLYSDGCGGQNKNRFIFCMFLYAAKVLDIEITHRFFVKGHSQNEGDSMHSVIERNLKNKIIFTPEEVYHIIQNSKVTGEDYAVNVLTQEDILNIKELVDSSHWVKDTNGNTIRWKDIMEICVSPTKPGKLEFKYDFDDEYSELQIIKNSNVKNKRGRKRASKVTCLYDVVLRPAYTEPIPIKTLLLKDLQGLCKSKAIHPRYHQFYNSLSSQKGVHPSQESDSSDSD